MEAAQRVSIWLVSMLNSDDLREIVKILEASEASEELINKVRTNQIVAIMREFGRVNFTDNFNRVVGPYPYN